MGPITIRYNRLNLNLSTTDWPLKSGLVVAFVASGASPALVKSRPQIVI